MGKIDIVAGIERTAILRNPNGLQCDCCGMIENMGRDTYKQELEDFVKQGWVIMSLDHSNKTTNDYCPDCANETSSAT